MSEHPTVHGAISAASPFAVWTRLGLPPRIRNLRPTNASNQAFGVRLSTLDGDRLRVVAEGPAGRIEAETRRPRVDRIASIVAAGDTKPWKLACRTGESLYAAAFTPEIAELYLASVEMVNGAPLSIVLDVDDDLQSLPWELLRDPSTERFLGLTEQTPLSRSVERSPNGNQARGPIDRGNLRVLFLADHLDERHIELSTAEAANPRIDLRVSDRPGGNPKPHVVIVSGPGFEAPPASSEALFIVVGADKRNTTTAIGGRPTITLPASMTPRSQEAFVTALMRRLASGEHVDEAVVGARRFVADRSTMIGLDWTEPVFFGNPCPSPLVVPARNVAFVAGGKIATRTSSWFRDAPTGSLSSVAFLLAGILIYRLNFSTSKSIALDMLSPFDLFSTFKAMILALSTYQDRILLILALGVLVPTLLVGFVRLRHRKNAATFAAGHRRQGGGALHWRPGTVISDHRDAHHRRRVRLPAISLAGGPPHSQRGARFGDHAGGGRGLDSR